MIRKALITLAVVLPVWVQAADFKIGFVNTDRIFRESNMAKQSQTKLEAEFSKREKAINQMGVDLKGLSEQFEKDAPTLSESQRLQRQRELVQKDQEFQSNRRAFQEDLAIRKNEELQKVLERANKVIKDLAVAESYDMIVQEAVYMNPKHDVTEKVIKSLNAAK